MRNITKEEKYHAKLIGMEEFVPLLQENLRKDPSHKIMDEIRGLSKEILWLMRDELALSPKHIDTGMYIIQEVDL